MRRGTALRTLESQPFANWSRLGVSRLKATYGRRGGFVPPGDPIFDLSCIILNFCCYLNQEQANAWLDEEDRLASEAAAASTSREAPLGQRPENTGEGWLADEDIVLCAQCGGQVAADEFYRTFQVNMCYDCRGRDDTYRLITKGTAKEDYLLSDGSLAHLTYIERKNPRDPRFNKMKLFLLRDVQEVAVAKHGSLDAIEPERERRLEESLRRKEARILKKVRKSEAEARPVPAKVRRIGQYHEHYFPPEREAYDEETGVWLQSCECGFTIAFDKF